MRRQQRQLHSPKSARKFQGHLTLLTRPTLVWQSDFARLEADTSSAEDESQKAYDSFMSDSAENKAVKSTQSKHKSNKKTQNESALATAKKDLAGTQEELDAAMAYYEKLKPSCVDAGESYEERVARRKAE